MISFYDYVSRLCILIIVAIHFTLYCIPKVETLGYVFIELQNKNLFFKRRPLFDSSPDRGGILAVERRDKAESGNYVY